MDLWLLQDHISSFHNLITRGKSTLDGYDIWPRIKILYSEYEWHFHFRNLTVELYTRIHPSPISVTPVPGEGTLLADI